MHISGTSHWQKEHQLLRIHRPTNGDVRDIQISIDDVVVSLGDNVSYSPDRNDVLIPLKKTYVHRDISELVEIMKEIDRKQEALANQQDGLSRVFQEHQELFFTALAVHQEQRQASSKKMLWIGVLMWFLMAIGVLANGVLGTLFKDY